MGAVFFFFFLTLLFLSHLQFGKHELRLSELTFDDSGMYQCIAENRHGVIYANAELRVFGERVLSVGVMCTFMAWRRLAEKCLLFPSARRRTVIDLLITPVDPPSESLITCPLFFSPREA